MTLIASVTNPGFIGISDIAISSARSSSTVAALPLFHGVRHFSYPQHSIVGTAQKTVLIDDRHAIMWAGSQIIAENLIRLASQSIDAVDNGGFYSLIDTSGLSNHELSQVSLINHRIDANGQLRREGHNIKDIRVDGMKIMTYGTGDWDFFDSTAIQKAHFDDDGRNSFFTGFLMRVGHALINEVDRGHPLAFAYGGWFELLMGGVQNLNKVPYLFKLWKWDDGHIVDLPAFQCWYDDHTLYILSVDLARPEPERLFLNVVSDGLHAVPAERVERDWEPKQKPEFQFHALLAADKWHLWISGGTDDYSLTISSDQVQQEFTQTFVNTIERLARGGGAHYAIQRPFEQ